MEQPDLDEICKVLEVPRNNLGKLTSSSKLSARRRNGRNEPDPAFERHMVAQAAKVALVVGTVLTVVNQGGAPAAGPMTLPECAKCGPSARWVPRHE